MMERYIWAPACPAPSSQQRLPDTTTAPLGRWQKEGGHAEHLCLTVGEQKSHYLSSMLHRSSRGCGPRGAPIGLFKNACNTPPPRRSSPLTPELQKHQLFRTFPCWNLSTATLFTGELAVFHTTGETINASPNPSGGNKTWRWLVWRLSHDIIEETWFRMFRRWWSEC